ncbi:hypothetical protein D1007_42543 [Hordeum vulgare]|nr:hypothetical protein D1007_42543 [Hordeum vulgare]
MTKAPPTIAISDSTPPLSPSSHPPPPSPSPRLLHRRVKDPPTPRLHHCYHLHRRLLGRCALAMVFVAVFSTAAVKDPLAPSSPSPLGHWDTPELAAGAYDAKAAKYHKEKLILKFPYCREYAQFLTLENIRICTSYFGCPGWTTIAIAYEMEAGERATFYLDYDRDELMVYYMPAGTDDNDPLTPNYDPDSAHSNVELAS